MREYRNNFDELEAGDEVFFDHSGRELSKQVVLRTTKTQIVFSSGAKFFKLSGKLVGDRPVKWSFTYTKLLLVNSESEREYQEQILRHLKRTLREEILDSIRNLSLNDLSVDALERVAELIGLKK